MGSESSGKAKRHAALVKFNQEVMDQLSERLAENPGLLDIKDEFLSIWYATSKDLFPPAKKKQASLPAGEFAKRIVKTLRSKEWRIAHTLSDQARDLMFGNDHKAHNVQPSSNAIASSLCHLLERAEVLFEGYQCGSVVVWKVNDSLVVKYPGGRDTTEYSTLRYLAEHAPELPVPKPHGLLVAGQLHISFQTYFPSMTLRDAWPSLTAENKLSIKAQLSDIVSTWRSIPLPPGTPLGGIGGEGVKDFHGWAGDQTTERMTTAQEFVEWQFSYDHPMPETWREFIRSVTPPVDPSEPIVVTHGDLWPPNIMVDRSVSGEFHVTGIIDWEFSGFYPAHFEAARILHNCVLIQNDDWWKYVPSCLEPSSNPHQWLARLLWEQACR